ncbi:MAG TPA: metallophosphoesterase [Gemmataceae bacterium]|nr:metallophosphoesterase [Gemmataceae bacterium]
MKKLILAGGVCALLAAAVALSRFSLAESAQAEKGDLQIKSEGKNPWTHLKLNTDPHQFQFAVVSDRTGGHREKVFSRAVQQINLLQPNFVMSVGDLIEGYSLKEDVIKNEWDEFDSFTRKFEMPFFYTPGNHDLTNKTMTKSWEERYGRKYYHFVYKNTLFLSLCSENPPDMGTIDAPQIEYVKKTLEENKGVRWTFVFLHKPIWTARDLVKNGWGEVEKALAGTKYTVFCGHVHRYQKFVRNGMNYYQLATTGGGSKLRGAPYGEFDHVAWVTMKKDAPLIANVMLEGILPEDLKVPESDEKGRPVKKVPTFPVSIRVTLDGKPAPGVTVSFQRLNKDKQPEAYVTVCDGMTDEKGQLKMTTYSQFDGSPVGEFVVTFAKTARGGYYDTDHEGEKSQLPERYKSPTTAAFKVTVKEGANEFNDDLRTA